MTESSGTIIYILFNVLSIDILQCRKCVGQYIYIYMCVCICEYIYLFIYLFTYLFGDRGSTVVKVLCYKSEGRWFHASWYHWILH